MSDGTAERGQKRRRIDDGTAVGNVYAVGGDAAAGIGTAGAIGWVVVHKSDDPILFSSELQLSDADKMLISRALALVTHYPYEIQYLTQPVAGASRSVSDKVKYNLQACPQLPPSSRSVGGPCMQVEVEFPIGVVLSMSLFNDISAVDPARIPLSEIKFTTRAGRGANNTVETIFIALFRVYALPQTQERITYIHHGYVSPHSHPPSAIPVPAERNGGGGFASWLPSLFSR